MTTYPVMSTMGVGRGIVLPNDSIWRLQPPATSPRGIVELWNGNSGSSAPPSIMRTGVYGMGVDGTVWEYTPTAAGGMTELFTGFTPTIWNSADNVGMTLSNNNLTATCSAAGGIRAAKGVAVGAKNYFETQVTPWSTFGNTFIGVATPTANLSSPGANAAIMSQAGGIYIFGSNVDNVGSRASGDIIGIAVDMVNKNIWFRVPSGIWNNSGTANPATNVGGYSISALTPPLYPYFNSNNGGNAAIANFGGSTFSSAVPTGFVAGVG